MPYKHWKCSSIAVHLLILNTILIYVTAELQVRSCPPRSWLSGVGVTLNATGTAPGAVSGLSGVCQDPDRTGYSLGNRYWGYNPGLFYWQNPYQFTVTLDPTASYVIGLAVLGRNNGNPLDKYYGNTNGTNNFTLSCGTSYDYVSGMGITNSTLGFIPDSFSITCLNGRSCIYNGTNVACTEGSMSTSQIPLSTQSSNIVSVTTTEEVTSASTSAYSTASIARATSSTTLTTTTPNNALPNKSDSTTLIIIISSVSGTFGLLLMTSVALVLLRRHRRKLNKERSRLSLMMTSPLLQSTEPPKNVESFVTSMMSVFAQPRFVTEMSVTNNITSLYGMTFTAPHQNKHSTQ